MTRRQHLSSTALRLLVVMTILASLAAAATGQVRAAGGGNYEPGWYDGGDGCLYYYDGYEYTGDVDCSGSGESGYTPGWHLGEDGCYYYFDGYEYTGDVDCSATGESGYEPGWHLGEDGCLYYFDGYEYTGEVDCSGMEAGPYVEDPAVEDPATISDDDPGDSTSEYTCIDGYVWREAAPGDLVCVEPWVRDQVAFDNAEAPYRVDPNGAYGPQSCVQGYVWREAFPGDLVCVEPWMRDQAANDNAAASSRWVGSPTTEVPSSGAVGPYEPGMVDTVVAGGSSYVGANAAGAFEPGLDGALVGAIAIANGDQTVDYGASAGDNAQPATTGPRIWASIYYHDDAAGCWYDEEAEETICRASSSGLIPRIQINGEGFSSFGAIFVGVYLPGTGTDVAAYSTATSFNETIQVGTAFFDCTGKSSGVVRYEVQAYDWTTDTWSNTITIETCQAVY